MNLCVCGSFLENKAKNQTNHFFGTLHHLSAWENGNGPIVHVTFHVKALHHMQSDCIAIIMTYTCRSQAAMMYELHNKVLNLSFFQCHYSILIFTCNIHSCTESSNGSEKRESKLMYGHFTAGHLSKVKMHVNYTCHTSSSSDQN